jgi:hypothetical protein
MWERPSRLLVNAISLPFGDQAGSVAKNSPSGVDGSPRPFVSRTSRPPDAPTP